MKTSLWITALLGLTALAAYNFGPDMVRELKIYSM